jgi:hypothetical protein
MCGGLSRILRHISEKRRAAKQTKKQLIIPHHTVARCAFALLSTCRLITPVPDELFCSN